MSGWETGNMIMAELAELRAKGNGKAMNHHGHTEPGFEMHPTAAARHLVEGHGRDDLATSEALDLNLEHRLLHGAVRVEDDESTEMSRALLQAGLYLEDAGPEGPARLREAIGRLAQPLPEIMPMPLGSDAQWRHQNRLDGSLSHAVHLTRENPGLFNGSTGVEAAQVIVAMARVFGGYLAEAEGS